MNDSDFGRFRFAFLMDPQDQILYNIWSEGTISWIVFGPGGLRSRVCSCRSSPHTVIHIILTVWRISGPERRDRPAPWVLDNRLARSCRQQVYECNRRARRNITYMVGTWGVDSQRLSSPVQIGHTLSKVRWRKQRPPVEEVWWEWWDTKSTIALSTTAAASNKLDMQSATPVKFARSL